MEVFTKIHNTSDKAIAELSKIPNTWNAQSNNVIKYVIDKLKLCFDELNFQLQKKDAIEEANLLSKLNQYVWNVFDKIEELQKRPVTNPPQLPMEYCMKPYQMKQKSLFGGTEIIPYEQYKTMQNDFMSAEQVFRSTKKKAIRNVQSKGTDTNEDALNLLTSTWVHEKQAELASAELLNEENLLELEKQLKLKGLWQEMHPSNAVPRMSDITKNLERDVHKNELFLNEQIRIMNLQQEDEEYKDIKKEFKEKITIIQRKTADKIMKFAEKKIKSEYDKFLMKRTAGLLMRKSRASNFNRLDELENLIQQKNQEIVDKEAKLSEIMQNFLMQETKLHELLNEVDNYRHQEHQDAFKSSRNLSGLYDIEIQVSFPDPKILTMEIQLQEIVSENEHVKEKLKKLHDQAKEEKRKTMNDPKQIEEVLLLILTSEMQSDSKIETIEALLNYIKEHSDDDITQLAPNEIYKQIRQKIRQKQSAQQIDNDESDEVDDEQSIEKTRKVKVKKQKRKNKGGERSSELSSYTQSEIKLDQSDKEKTANITIKKQKNKKDDTSNEVSEYTDGQKVKQKQLLKITEESQIIQKKSARQDRQEQISIKTPKSKREGYLKVEQDKQIQLTPQSNSQPHIPAQKSSQFKTIESQRHITNPSTNRNQQQSPRDIQLKNTFTRKTEKFTSEEVDIEYLSENQMSRGIQINPKQSNVGCQYPLQDKVMSQNGSQMLGSQDQTEIKTPPSRYSFIEKVTQKSTQTDDFILWKHLQEMAKDIGLTEEQLKKLEALFLNENQILDFYAKDEQQKQMQRSSSQFAVTPFNPNGQNSSQNQDMKDSTKQSQVSQFGTNPKDRNESQSKTDEVQSYDPQQGHKKRVSILQYQKSMTQMPTKESLHKDKEKDNKILLSYTNENSLQINHRSLSQTSDKNMYQNNGRSPSQEKAKQQRVSQSQKILEDMLKNKSNLGSPYDGEQREQRLFYNIFGDEYQNEQEFELEALRQNFGKPFELIIDHMKEETIKRVFNNFVSRGKNQWSEAMYLVISQFANKPPQQITYTDFKKYYENYMRVHMRCGEQCIHIQRFLNRIGFGLQTKRKLLNTSKQSLTPFGQLPKLK